MQNWTRSCCRDPPGGDAAVCEELGAVGTDASTGRLAGAMEGDAGAAGAAECKMSGRLPLLAMNKRLAGLLTPHAALSPCCCGCIPAAINWRPKKSARFSPPAVFGASSALTGACSIESAGDRAFGS